MCDPVTLLAGSTGLKVAGDISQGRAARKQADWQAGQLDRQAAEEQDLGAQQAAKTRKRTAQDRGSAVAAYAGAGIKVGEGSALEVERYIEQEGETDAMMYLLNSDRRASALRDQAGMTRKAGRDAQRASYVSAVGSLLSGGYQSGMKWGKT
ncbi:MAG: virion core protein, T7 gp14 family [Burkholderiaceae bacterium]